MREIKMNRVFAAALAVLAAFAACGVFADAVVGDVAVSSIFSDTVGSAIAAGDVAAFNDTAVSGDAVVSGGIAADTVEIERHGRRIQVDGFLLEWGRGDARGWGASEWMWDAVNTVDGVAGYFRLFGPPPGVAWVFGFGAGGRSREVEVPGPGPRSGDIFAFHHDEDGRGSYTVEWLVPWSVFGEGAVAGGDGRYALSLSAAAVGGGVSLPPVVLSVSRKAPSQSGALSSYILMFLAAAATVVIVRARRRRF
jgi:hypothetical protein